MRSFVTFLLLWLSALANAIELGCGIPFPMDNGTLSELEALANNSNMDPGSLGSASMFGHNDQYAPKLWPRDPATGRVVINYCYYDHISRGMIAPSQLIEAAIELWMRALGGPASQATRHGIVFKERQYNGYPLYCYEHGSWENWNHLIPLDTLVIRHVTNAQLAARATVGYYNMNPPHAWKMQMQIGLRAEPTVVVHELGHVFGMVHEHQRVDRDTYVKYQCERVPQFANAWALASQAGYTVRQLCEDPVIGLRYGFPVWDWTSGYATGASDNQGQPRVFPIFSDSAQYDLYSVMHYGTLVSCANDLSTCPLVKYRDPNNHAAGVEVIAHNGYPSPLDAQWVKETYSYYGQA
ncbi:hypothetical protein BU24DRAFT_78049 [Aaosphaeria arxii CBS 175.79]|uniref:Peptidase M12A domain-containing protein n=1 Tax=Aaosphaeria arxii CBS 175.79 TaxID=1450172 RepID=A0A6A5X9C6_9PLEO|nr:uncharacterized protein BU24DRAFT_78049 [Aaosphaeria arxii CBS 175.79]KAF2009551.1 hypothetical protein BU24DRAFT_78049 [Aaosphaeria arxii CBS 175.79]